MQTAAGLLMSQLYAKSDLAHLARALTAAVLAMIAASSALAHVVSWDSTGRFAGEYTCVTEAGAAITFDEKKNLWRGISTEGNTEFLMKVKKGQYFTVGSDKRRVRAYTVEISLASQAKNLSPCLNSVKVPASGPSAPLTIGSNGELFCHQISFAWHVNLKTGRFLSFFHSGYVSRENDLQFGPSMRVGKCFRSD